LPDGRANLPIPETLVIINGGKTTATGQNPVNSCDRTIQVFTVTYMTHV